jgi:hypothetical protein
VARSLGVRPPTGPRVLAGPTLNARAPLVAGRTSSRIMASQDALPGTGWQAGLPTAYRMLPAAGRVVASVVVAAVAVAAVTADPATAAATAPTVSQ